MSSRDYSLVPPRILVHPSNPHGSGEYRVLQPARALKDTAYAITQISPILLPDEVLKIARPDVVVFQLQMHDFQIENIKRYRRALPNAFLVYECDDAYWHVPEASAHHDSIPKDIRDRMRAAAKLCDAITVTTPALAEAFRKLTGLKDVRVIGNYISSRFLSDALAGRKNHGAIAQSDGSVGGAAASSNGGVGGAVARPRLGWAGGIGHAGDLRILKPVIEALRDEVDFVFIGMTPEGIDPATLEVHKAVPYSEFAKTLGSLNLDIALAPLEDNPFNEAKSNLKVQEYGAAGFCTIASNIVTYRDTPAILVPNSAAEWVKTIRGLLLDPERRDREAQRLHDWVKKERILESNVLERERAWLPRNAIPFQPRANLPFRGAVVAVGATAPGIATFPSIEDAWSAVPGADILYGRSGVALDQSKFDRLRINLGQNASATALTNDGLYPLPGKFSAIPADIADKLDAAALWQNNDATESPFPSGPCFLLSGDALARFGLPLGSNPELACVDWGARVLEGGHRHVCANDIFVRADRAAEEVQKGLSNALNHACAWTPGLVGALRGYREMDAVAKTREDLDIAYHAMNFRAPQVLNATYSAWAAVRDTLTRPDNAAIAADMASWENCPRISIILPTYNTKADHLRECIESVLAQLYPDWELCCADDGSSDPEVVRVLEEYASRDSRILLETRSENGHICRASNDALKLASCEWTIFLDHDDVLAPHALYCIAKEINAHPDVQFLYSDSDKLSPAGERIDPYYAPGFNYELLLAQNYVTHIAVYRTEGIRAIGGLREGFEGSQDWDLALRYLEATCGTPPNRDLIRHIPHVLYHWRQTETSTAQNILAKPYALEAGRKAVEEHLQRTRQAAFVGPNPVVPVFNMVRFLVPADAPSCDIIIPTRDNPAQLNACLGSLMARTVYSNFRVVILDNGSTDKKALRILEEAARDQRIAVRRVPGPFNYAAMMNSAVRSSTADFICLLNDDTEVLEPSWLNDMVGLAARTSVGAVGAKLLYRHHTVQAFGITYDPAAPGGTKALHAFQQLDMRHPGHFGRAQITQEFAAVTGACLVIKRDRWLGMDETRFPVDFNDVDLCFRLYQKGYRNIGCAQALLLHHEGQTKARTGVTTGGKVQAAEAALLAAHEGFRDPYRNPNWLHHPHFTGLTPEGVEKPWGRPDRTAMLIVNGREDDFEAAWRDGYVPYGAVLDGHYLTFQRPALPHVVPLDLRESPEALLDRLGRLGITRVNFCGIGDGTIGALGFFAAVADAGWPIDYRDDETARDRHVPEGSWLPAWEAFYRAINDVEEKSDAA